MIRNVDGELYARFKSDAARRKIPLAQELELAFSMLEARSGTGKDLLKLPTFKGKLKIDNPSEHVDEIVGDALSDDYRRIQRPSRDCP